MRSKLGCNMRSEAENDWLRLANDWGKAPYRVMSEGWNGMTNGIKLLP